MSKLKFCVKTWMGSFSLSGFRDQNVGENGAQDQKNGKKIGINGSWIYHVTTLRSEFRFIGVRCCLFVCLRFLC